tara:strand:- start:169068 stop:169295 length:228 start_codon:yes stop_codon:yes gene_type:complete
LFVGFLGDKILRMTAEAKHSQNPSSDYIDELELTEMRRKQFLQTGEACSDAELRAWIEARKLDKDAPCPKTSVIE